MACIAEDNITRNPDICYNEAVNFLVDLDWRSYEEELARKVPFKPIKELVALVDDLNESSVPLQNVLFGLPFYYVGK